METVIATTGATMGSVRGHAFHGLLIFASLLLTPTSRADSEEPSPPPRILLASEVEWRGIFGEQKGSETQGYVLMAREFLGIPFFSGEPNQCQDLEKVVVTWLARHPTAKLIPVRRIPFDEEFSFLFVWLVDAEESLNVALVRQGCAEARKMSVDDEENLLVSGDEYRRFVEAVTKAEAAAIREKAGIWGKPGGGSAAHWATAERLQQEGKYAQAIAEFKASLDGGFHDRFAWHRIGRCYEAVQQYQAAIDAYDEAMRLEGEPDNRFTKIAKAQCVAKLQGGDKAAEVLGAQAPDCSKSLGPCLDLAVVHYETDVKESLRVLEQGVNVFVAHNNLKFDELEFALDKGRVKRSDKYWLSVNDLALGLPTLATYSLGAGDLDRAVRYATMGLSVRHAIMEHLKDRYDARVVEAGDFHARLVLARVYGKQGKFDEAKHEVDLAKVLIDLGYIQGGHVKDVIDAAYEELRQQFPDRTVNVAPTMQPTPKKRTPKVSPADLAAMDEGQLIATAAADDQTSAFAALEELVARHTRGQVSAAGLAQLVKDGLVRHAQTDNIWRAQYGVFIEEAWDKGVLSQADTLRYIRASALVDGFRAAYAPFDLGTTDENARVHVSGSVECRLGGSPALKAQRSFEAKLSVVVSLDEVTIDGVKYSLVSDPRREIISLGVGMSGFGSGVADTRDLKVGTHALTARGTLTFYRGALGARPREFDPAKVEPLAVVPFTEATEFEVERD